MVAMRAELDVRCRDRRFKGVGLGGLHADERLAIELQLKRLAVERSGAAQLERVAVRRVLRFNHGHLPIEAQFADAIESAQRAVAELKLLDHGYVQRRRRGLICRMLAVARKVPIGTPRCVAFAHRSRANQSLLVEK